MDGILELFQVPPERVVAVSPHHGIISKQGEGFSCGHRLCLVRRLMYPFLYTCSCALSSWQGRILGAAVLFGILYSHAGRKSDCVYKMLSGMGLLFAEWSVHHTSNSKWGCQSMSLGFHGSSAHVLSSNRSSRVLDQHLLNFYLSCLLWELLSDTRAHSCIHSHLPFSIAWLGNQLFFMCWRVHLATSLSQDTHSRTCSCTSTREGSQRHITSIEEGVQKKVIVSLHSLCPACLRGQLCCDVNPHTNTHSDKIPATKKVVRQSTGNNSSSAQSPRFDL